MNKAFKRSANNLFKVYNINRIKPIPLQLNRHYETSFIFQQKLNKKINTSSIRLNTQRSTEKVNPKYRARFDRPKYSNSVYLFCVRTDEENEIDSMYGNVPAKSAQSLVIKVSQKNSDYYSAIENFDVGKELIIEKLMEIKSMEDHLKKTMKVRGKVIPVGEDHFQGITDVDFIADLKNISEKYLELGQISLEYRMVDIAEYCGMFSYYADPTQWKGLLISMVASFLDHSYFRFHRIQQVLRRNETFNTQDKLVKKSVNNFIETNEECVQFMRMKGNKDFSRLYAKSKQMMFYSQSTVDDIQIFNDSLSYLFTKILEIRPAMADNIYYHPNVNPLVLSLYVTYFTKSFSSLLDYGILTIDNKPNHNIPPKYAFYVVNDWVRHIKNEEMLNIKLAEFNEIIRGFWSYMVKAEHLNPNLFTSNVYKGFLLQAAQFNQIKHLNNVVKHMTKKRDNFNSNILKILIDIGGKIAMAEEKYEDLHPLLTFEGMVNHLSDKKLSIIIYANMLKAYHHRGLDNPHFLTLFSKLKGTIKIGGLMVIAGNIKDDELVKLVEYVARNKLGDQIDDRNTFYDYALKRIKKQESIDYLKTLFDELHIDIQ